MNLSAFSTQVNKLLINISALLIIQIVGCALLPGLHQTVELEPLDISLVEGGIFIMGDSWNYSDEDASPVHTVDVNTFYMSKYEITIGQYVKFARKYNYKLPDNIDYKQSNIPITYIDWDEAREFCDCYGYRLPTEVEWEYAARSRGKKERYSGTDDRLEADKYVVSLDNSDEILMQVGSKLPNGIGIYDLSGNVYEWIGEYYAQYTNNDEPVWADLGTKNLRIIRGGCYSTYPIANYVRAGVFRDEKSPRIGFRCVK